VTLGAFFLIAYIVVGIAQIWAGIEGMQLTFGIGGFLAVVLLVVVYAIPIAGTAAVAFLTYYGARYGWTWAWWQALALAAPGIILMLGMGVAAGLAIWAQRLSGLIPLHHHLATPTEKTGNGGPGAKSRRQTGQAE